MSPSYCGHVPLSIFALLCIFVVGVDLEVLIYYYGLFKRCLRARRHTLLIFHLDLGLIG